MDKFAIYSGQSGSIRVLVTMPEVGNAPGVQVAHFKGGVWVPVGKEIHDGVAAEVLAFALLLQQPATYVAVGDQPEMPVWVVLPETKGSALLALLNRKICDTSNDMRMPAVRA